MPPVVSGSDVTEVDSNAGGNQTFVITGSNFTSGGTIAFVGTDNSDLMHHQQHLIIQVKLQLVAPRHLFLIQKNHIK